ncbi:MAG: hypothetical protein HYX40_11535 [Sphingobacteriales bacterium]|nr:hypothetical protein [Sphingobacteriales bacterium]
MKKINPHLILFITLLVAFLPIVSFSFALKNDLFLGYYPPKFLTGEVLHNGDLPLWNPYISFGIPFYGDMNGGFWSPITWFIASTTGYNVYILTIEVLLYLWIGGSGMYYLTSHWVQNKNIRLIAAIAFMCCGFNIGHLQHLNWISGAAFLPWCLWSFIKVNVTGVLKYYLVSALLFYFFISSAHPGLIICTVYLFLSLFILFLIRSYQTAGLKGASLISKRYFFLFLLLTMLCAGIIAGYTDIIPHFSRGNIVSLRSSLAQPTTAQSWVSLLLPFSTTKNQDLFQTDIAMRNSYFGLLLFIFLLSSIPRQKTFWQKFLLITGMIFLLLSTGGLFKTIAYYCIPFAGYIRLNGEFRIFSLLCFIPAAAIALDKYLSGSYTMKFPKYLSLVVACIAAIIITWSLYMLIRDHESILFANVFFSNPESLNTQLKKIVDSISFYDTIIIQVTIQLVLLFLLIKNLTSKNSKWLLLLSIIDLSLATELNLPFTGVGKNPVSQLSSIHNHSPKGIITPPIQPLFKNDTLSRSDSTLVGEWGFYNKQIGSPKRVLYPVQLKNTVAYYTAMERDSTYNMRNNPFLFIGETEGNKIIADTNNHIANANIKSFSTNKIILEFNSTKNSKLIFLQNYYPHWYYYKDGKRYTMDKAGINFMSVPVSKGENELLIQFEPQIVKVAMMISFGIFILYIFLLFFPGIKPAFLS